MLKKTAMMKVSFSLFILLCSTLTWANPKITLEACYQSALNYHETLPIAEADIRQVAARYQQIIGAVTPKVSFFVNETLQDSTGDSSSLSSFTKQSRPDVHFGLTQPVFHGLIEFYGVKKNKLEQQQKSFLYDQAKWQLYKNVAEAFYQIAALEEALASNRNILSSMRSQLTELANRFSLGKVREAELAREKSSIAILEAENEKLKGDIQVAYEILSFLTGLKPQPPIAYSKLNAFKLASLQFYLDKTILRPDIMAAQKQIEMSIQAIKMAKGEFWPKVDLEANYYLYRTGFQNEIDWDALIKTEVPLFNFGTFGKVKEAKSKKIQDELRYQLQIRKTLSEVKQAYTALQSQLKEYQKFSYAAGLAYKAYQLLLADYRLGLATQLDVLQSEESYRNTLKQKNNALIQSWLGLEQLKINAGIIP